MTEDFKKVIADIKSWLQEAQRTQVNTQTINIQKLFWVHHIQTVGNQSQTEISNTTKRRKSVKEIVLKEQT